MSDKTEDQSAAPATGDDALTADPATVEVRASAEPAPEPAAATVSASQPAKRRGGAIAALALLLSLAALTASGYLWWKQLSEVTRPAETPDYEALIAQQGQALEQRLSGTVERARDQLEQRLAEVERSAERLRAERQSLDSALADLEAGNRRTISAFERRLGHLESGVAAMADTRTDTGDEMALAEAEYLMRAASERLQLFNDPKGAQRALALALEQLDTVDDPIYLTARRTLVTHQQDLAQLKLPDRVALSGRLLGLARSSVQWPLDARRSLNATGSNLLVPEEGEDGWWPKMKAVLSNVVVVHREKDTATVLLTLEEERLLRENVRLQLQVAQLAAARGEQPLFDASIAAVKDWMDEYYDGASLDVGEAKERLEELAAVDLNPPLPDITLALRQLRSVRATEDLAERAGTQAAEAPE